METKQTATVNMTITKFRQEIVKNWALIAVLAVINLISCAPAYFLSGWWSVLVTFGFIVFSTIVGYFAITRGITKTIEYR